MIEEIRRICELQRSYSPDNTAAMQERGQLIRTNLANEVRALAQPLSAALGRFGNDFQVDASDGIGRKTELPWVRFCSEMMSPSPTEGFYVVLHFATDGSAFFITVGCGSSRFHNGSFVRLPNAELDRRTHWARQVMEEVAGTLEPFTDEADFGAKRPLPKSFERATALAKRVDVGELETTDIRNLLTRAAEFLRIVYRAVSDGREIAPADLDEIEITRVVEPLSVRRTQGMGLTPADRKQVELQAMRLARDWLEANGYQVTDRSANHPFDLEAARDGNVLKVEVKGTTSDAPDAILMTRNEVDLHRAEKGSTALVIVSGVRLVVGAQGREAVGGKLQPFIGWDIDLWQLTPTTYRVAKPS